MAIRKRNIIRVIILFIFALSALGFKNSTDRPVEPVEEAPYPKSYNYIDIESWRDIFWNPPNMQFSGTTPSVPVSLSIGPVTSDFRGVIQVAQAFSYLLTNGTGTGGISTHQGGGKQSNPSQTSTLAVFFKGNVLRSVLFCLRMKID